MSIYAGVFRLSMKPLLKSPASEEDQWPPRNQNAVDGVVGIRRRADTPYHPLDAKLGVDLPETAKILDIGCRAGRTVRALRARGFVNTYGYDVGDGRTLVGAERDHIKVGSLLDLRLPYEDNTFDLVISDQVCEHVQDQVRAFEKLLRFTRPGGHGLHIIPATHRRHQPDLPGRARGSA